MREIKSNLVKAKDDNVVILHGVTYSHGLIKANRILLLLVATLMLIIFVLGFLVFPVNDVLDVFEKEINQSSSEYEIKNPVISAEIDILKGQLVGLVSGSIENKLRTLEESVRSGNVSSSLGTIQGLKADVKSLRVYSGPGNKKVNAQGSNEALMKEVSHLKRLIYLTITSCGLMIAAMGGIWIRKHYTLKKPESIRALGRS